MSTTIKNIIIFLALILILPYVAKADCQDKPLALSLNEFTQKEPTIYFNGSLLIHLGSSDAYIVDAYLASGDSVNSIDSSLTVKTDTDDRNFLLKWAFPKDPIPPQYYLSIYPNQSFKTLFSTKEELKVIVTLRQGTKTYNGTFFINSGISYTCRYLNKATSESK